MTEIAIKGASGLGDSIYLYPIALHFSKLYDKIHLMTNFPELFEPIKNVTCFRHLKLNYIPIMNGKTVRKKDIDIRFTYGPRKHKQGTSQFEDMCIFAKEFGYDIPKLELKIPWEVKNTKLVDTVKSVAKGRPVCIVAAPYEPFGREDEWGAVLRIRPEIIQSICDKHRKDILFISTGNKYVLHRTRVENDMIDQTSIADLMDLVSISNICLSQIGNLLPMAECMGKKNFIIFAEGIPGSEHKFIRAITPEKTVHYKHLNKSIYDNAENVEDLFHEFCK